MHRLYVQKKPSDVKRWPLHSRLRRQTVPLVLSASLATVNTVQESVQQPAILVTTVDRKDIGVEHPNARPTKPSIALATKQDTSSDVARPPPRTRDVTALRLLVELPLLQAGNSALVA